MRLSLLHIAILRSAETDLQETKTNLTALPTGRDMNRIIESIDRAQAWVTATIARGELDTDSG